MGFGGAIQVGRGQEGYRISVFCSQDQLYSGNYTQEILSTMKI
jgi:hypothetical protein